MSGRARRADRRHRGRRGTRRRALVRQPPAPSPAKAGDCITAPASGSFKTVGCTDSGAAFKVAAVLANGDSNGCDAYPAVIMAVVNKDGSKTLCLDSAK